MNWELNVSAIIVLGSLCGWLLKRRDQKKTYQKLNEYNKLKIDITRKWGEYNLLQAVNMSKIRDVMKKFVTKNRANYVHFCIAKNGGDHVSARKDYTISVLYEEHNTGKPPLKEYWQNVEAMDQLKDFYRHAVIEDYYYISNYKENMEKGAFKDHIDPTSGSDVAVFEIGKIGKEHYFLTFQFSHAGGSQTSFDKQRIKNICNNFNNLLVESEKTKENVRLMEKKLDMYEAELMKLKLL